MRNCDDMIGVDREEDLTETRQYMDDYIVINHSHICIYIIYVYTSMYMNTIYS